MLRTVFMGTPAFAVPSLERLHSAGFPIPLVVTQPDRPAGRKQQLTRPPVKVKALELGLDVFQPEKIKSDEAYETLRRLAPDVIAVVGYGQIIPQRILDLPPHGCVNVHASLLPKYRGAAPINWAIVNGETKTGVATMRLVYKLDAGDVLAVRETPIGPEETAPELARRLAAMGADLLAGTLQGLEAGTAAPQPQDHDQATYAPILKREDGLIDWNLPARSVFNRVRGFDPWPGAYSYFRGRRFHIRRARLARGASAPPGELCVRDNGLFVGCGEGDGLLEAVEVQPEGKSRMGAADFVRGYRPRDGERLTMQPQSRTEGAES